MDNSSKPVFEMRKYVKYAGILLIAFLVLASYIPIAESITITDALGRTVTIESTPKHVVSLAPSITELLFYLGLGDRVVGMDSISINDPYYNISTIAKEHNVTDVGGYWWSAISIEKIISLNPDLVIADKGAHKPLLQTFEDYNITVVYLNGGSAKSLQDIYEDVGIIAEIFNLTNKVQEFIKQVEDSFSVYRSKLTPYQNMTFLVVVGVYNGIWVAGKSTFIDDALSRLGLRNAADVIGWKAVSIEQIASWNPSIILVSSEVDNNTLKQSGLYTLNSKIIHLDKETTDAMSRPGPLIIKLPALLYKTLKTNIPVKSNTEENKRTETTPTTTTTPSMPVPTTTTPNLPGTNTASSNNAQAPRFDALTIVYIVAAFIIGLGSGYIVFKKSS